MWEIEIGNFHVCCRWRFWHSKFMRNNFFQPRLGIFWTVHPSPGPEYEFMWLMKCKSKVNFPFQKGLTAQHTKKLNFRCAMLSQQFRLVSIQLRSSTRFSILSKNLISDLIEKISNFTHHHRSCDPKTRFNSRIGREFSWKWEFCRWWN